MQTLAILDVALTEIDGHIAAHAPERGGALLTLPDRSVVVRFLFDSDAETTGASYRPSRALNRRVQRIEEDENLQLGGILHSHPYGLDHPSAQDARELATGLALNAHLDGYLAPIVTHDLSTPLGRHELPLTNAKLSFFIAQRDGGGSVVVRPQPVVIIPLQTDLRGVAQSIDATMMPAITVTDVEGMSLLAGQLTLAGGDDIFVLVDEHYPTTAPFVLASAADGTTTQLDIAWQLELPAEKRLHHALGAAFAAKGLGGVPRLETVRAGLFARSTGLLPETLIDREILVVGLGSVGSQMAEGLVRSGIGRVTLIDPETVEPANLSRTIYQASDVGRTKIDALTSRLRAIYPGIVVDSARADVLDLAPSALDAFVQRADLVIAATDDPNAQRALNRLAYGRGKPALFIGLYAGAQGGEVVFSVPGLTPCYLCATFARHTVESETEIVQSDVDYGTGRLPGEIALGADIQHVVSSAVKIALALVLRGDDVGLGHFLEPMLADRSSYLTMAMVPDYWFYPAVFAKTIGQFAYQSVWLTPTSRAECPVCGATPLDPLAVPLRTPRLSGLRERRGHPRPATSELPHMSTADDVAQAVDAHPESVIETRVTAGLRALWNFLRKGR